MAEGIEFLLELQAKLEGASKFVHALDGVESALKKTNEHLKGLEKHGEGVLHKMGDWFKEFGKSAAESFTGMFAAEAAWDTVKEGVHVLGELVGQMFEVAAEAERTKMAFTNMLGPEEGEALLGNLDRFSKATEFGRSQNKGFAQSLLDAGFAGDQLSLAMSAVSDVAARSRNKTEGAEAAIAALSRVMLTGTLDARALRMLKLSPKAVFKQMETDLGLGAKDLKKKLQAGSLKTDDVLNSVFKALAAKGGGTLGKVGADMADGFQARWEKFKEILPAIFEGLADAPGFKAFGGTLAEITERFSPEGPAGKAIVEGLSQALNKFGELLKGVDWESVTTALVDSFGAAFQVFKAMAETAGSFFKGVVEYGDWVQNARKKVLGAVGINVMTDREREAAEFNASPEMQALRRRHEENTARLRLMRASTDRGFEQLPGGGWAPRALAGLYSGRGMGASDLAVPPMLARPPEDRFMRGPDGKWMPITPPSVGARQSLEGARGGGGPQTVHVNTPVTVNVQGSDASAEQIAHQIKTEVPTAIVSQIEQLGLTGGTY